MSNIYTYKARDATGKVVSGQIQADDMNRAAAMLREKRMIVLQLNVGKAKSQGVSFLKKKGIPLKEFAMFCRQMATMVKAGVTIMSSISAIASQAENPVLGDALGEVGKDLESGKTFSEACQRHKDLFPTIFTSMVEAGEASGALDDVLERMADYFENQSEIQEKVKSASTYPIFIAVFAIGITIGLMVFVVPNFADMFAEGGMELPGITKGMLAVSDFMQNQFLLLIVMLIAAFIGLKRYLGTTKGKHATQRLSLKLPKFGTMFQNAAMARFCRSLSILVASGVPMITALEIVARVVNNVEYASAVLHARKGVSEGLTLTAGLSASPRFTPLLLHMLKVGEESGAMDTMLSKVADFYEAEVRYTVDRLSSIIEPFLILFLAGIVGLVLVAVMLPMFQMGDIVQP
ncbi:MAG: type II secretion system F family protein [Firmicutes bacterium]|nr:type II secretion system F family protein [Bacillota bacterium]